MKTTTITLFGHEYKLAINFGTLIAFERITSGKNALDFHTFTDGCIENIICLFYAMMKANNEDEIVPEFDDVLAIDDPKLMSLLITKTTEIYMAAMKPEPGDPSAKENSSDKEEDAPKNA